LRIGSTFISPAAASTGSSSTPRSASRGFDQLSLLRARIADALLRLRTLSPIVGDLRSRSSLRSSLHEASLFSQSSAPASVLEKCPLGPRVFIEYSREKLASSKVPRVPPSLPASPFRLSIALSAPPRKIREPG